MSWRALWEILQHFLGELIGSQGITLFGQTYTPDKIASALREAIYGNDRAHRRRTSCWASRFGCIRRLPGIGADALFHDLGTPPLSRSDLAVASRAQALGRGSAAQDCAGIAPLPDRHLCRRLLHRSGGLDRLWSRLPLAQCRSAGTDSRRFSSSFR